jgi:hypothetical protein
MSVKTYLLSFPERVIRSALGMTAGMTREVAEVVIPGSIRRSRLYQNLVDTTLQFMIEQVGGVSGVYEAAGELPDDFLARRTAGNVVELLGVVAFRASPVWVLAALADVCDMGRHLIPELAEALKSEGLLEKDAEFTTVDQLLDGLERTSSRAASTMNTPPLDVVALRREWEAIRNEARTLPPARLPSRQAISRIWHDLQDEAARQQRTIFETSSMMAISAVRAFPERAVWLYASSRVGAQRTGEVLAAALLDHYRQTLSEIRQVGYFRYASRQLQPYVRAAVNQFSPGRQTLTERLLERIRWRTPSR